MKVILSSQAPAVFQGEYLKLCDTIPTNYLMMCHHNISTFEVNQTLFWGSEASFWSTEITPSHEILNLPCSCGGWQVDMSATWYLLMPVSLDLSDHVYCELYLIQIESHKADWNHKSRNAYIVPRHNVQWHRSTMFLLTEIGSCHDLLFLRAWYTMAKPGQVMIPAPSKLLLQKQVFRSLTTANCDGTHNAMKQWCNYIICTFLLDNRLTPDIRHSEKCCTIQPGDCGQG